MNKQFWISIKENHFAFPAGYSIRTLTEELIVYIGSTDPELRDTIGLEAFYHWLTQGLYSLDDLRGIITQLIDNLQQNIGDIENDTVFIRSFSALWLANIISYDNKKNVLKKKDLLSILDAALAYFTFERDLRGYVPTKGWVHAIAHAADLLSALAISLHTDANDHLKILDSIADKLSDSTLSIYLYNEDSRMAQPVLWIFIRNTLTLDQIEKWLASLARDWNGAWQSEERTRAYNNGRNLLRSLFWYILKKNEEEISDKEKILKLVQDRVDEAKPWVW